MPLPALFSTFASLTWEKLPGGKLKLKINTPFSDYGRRINPKFPKNPKPKAKEKVRGVLPGGLLGVSMHANANEMRNFGHVKPPERTAHRFCAGPSHRRAPPGWRAQRRSWRRRRRRASPPSSARRRWRSSGGSAPLSPLSGPSLFPQTGRHACGWVGPSEMGYAECQ